MNQLQKIRDLIKKAVATLGWHDACDDCGKRTDGLMTCYYVDGTTTKVCPKCLTDSGFCYGCGNYCAGMSSFDFSDIPGYCSECREEIRAEFDLGYSEDEECDLPDEAFFDYDGDRDDDDPNDSRNL